MTTQRKKHLDTANVLIELANKHEATTTHAGRQMRKPLYNKSTDLLVSVHEVHDGVMVVVVVHILGCIHRQH